MTDLTLMERAILSGQLYEKARELYVLDVCRKYILDNDDFRLCSGSSKSFQHHYGDGGLLKHTCEVIDLCFVVKGYYASCGQHTDSCELFLAAFFHDLGKIHDYEKVDGEWRGTEHKRKVHHVSRSAAIWTEESQKSDEIYDRYYEDVLHAILAHHGNRLAGSPVAPKSRVAWMLHFCDGISARMNDADTLDVVSHYS